MTNGESKKIHDQKASRKVAQERRWSHEGINPHDTIKGKFVGQFAYSFEDLKNNELTLEEVGILAFGNFIFYEPERKEWFSMLEKKTGENPKRSIKEIIDEIRMEVGREPAREPKQSFPGYWIITPAGRGKKRRVFVGPLKNEQVQLLESKRFDILKTEKFTFEEIKSKFGDTIELVIASF